MVHAFSLEGSARRSGTERAHPLLFELAAAIQNLGWNPRTRVCQTRFVPSFFPNGAEVTRGPVAIDQFQVPAQERCRQWQLPHAFFQIHSHRAFASNRPEAPKCSQELWIKLSEQF